MKLTCLHTPGHTDESMSYALADAHSNKETLMVFTGDTLFSGDVGRTDLYDPQEAPRLAKNLFNSIFNKILPLGDAVTLCPAHGAGSICGGAISDREWSTLGYERTHNPALQKTLEEFVKFKTSEHHERPPILQKDGAIQPQRSAITKGSSRTPSAHAERISKKNPKRRPNLGHSNALSFRRSPHKKLLQHLSRRTSRIRRLGFTLQQTNTAGSGKQETTENRSHLPN